MSEAKTQHSVIGADVFMDLSELASPLLIGSAARFVSSRRVFDHLRPIFNVTISNIPGPQFPLYLAGARVVGIHPLGPVVEGAGLNMTVMSYLGAVYFGLNGCRETVPDLADLPKMVSDSLAELLQPPARRPVKGDPGLYALRNDPPQLAGARSGANPGQDQGRAGSPQ